MQMRISWKRAAGVAAAAAAVATLAAGCSGSSTAGSSTAGSSSGSGSSSSGGIAAAQAQVKKFTANPALSVSPLPSPPKSSTYAIQVSCSIPACDPGALNTPMAVLGWRFQTMDYDISKGPSAVQAALAQAVAAKPDVIIFVPNFPEAIFQSQVDLGTKEGIKFVDVAGTVTPGYSACIQCATSLEAGSALAVDIALADAGGKTVMAVTYDPAIAALVSEADGVKQEVAKNGDGSQVLEIQQSVSDTPAENAQRVVSFLQRNPNVKYLVTAATFVPAATLESTGLASRVKIVGMYPKDASEVASVKDGQVLAYSTGEDASLFWRAADAAARAVEGVKVDPIAPIQSLRVMDKTNADISLLDPANYQDIYKKAWHK